MTNDFPSAMKWVPTRTSNGTSIADEVARVFPRQPGFGTTIEMVPKAELDAAEAKLAAIRDILARYERHRCRIVDEIKEVMGDE